MAMIASNLIAFLGSAELLRPAIRAQSSKENGATKPDGRLMQPSTIEIVVVGKDSGKRLPGAKVRFSIDFGTSLREANRDGVVHFDLTKRVFQDSLNFDVWADGYVQQRFFFAQNDARYPKIPDQFTVELLPGEETLGGKVTDEQGRPIAGVKVTVWGYLRFRSCHFQCRRWPAGWCSRRTSSRPHLSRSRIQAPDCVDIMRRNPHASASGPYCTASPRRPETFDHLVRLRVNNG